MKNRKVYLVMCYHYASEETYVSEVCSTKEKAEKHREYISKLMDEHDPNDHRNYWVYDMRVS